MQTLEQNEKMGRLQSGEKMMIMLSTVDALLDTRPTNFHHEKHSPQCNLFIIFMRNIKISFEHPDYIYPFKLSVNAAHAGEVDSKSCKLAQQALQLLQKDFILSEEERKIISSLSVLFKAELVSQWTSKMKERRNIDYLGGSNEEHYQYFENKCREKVSLKNILELNHYIVRLKLRKNIGDFRWQKWIELCLLFQNNFSTGQMIIGAGQNIHMQLQTFLGLFLMIQSVNQLLNDDKTNQIPLRKILPDIQDTTIRGFLSLGNFHLQEQCLSAIMVLSKSIMQYLKARLEIDDHNPQIKQGNPIKKNPPSLIFWIINFNPNPKPKPKLESILSNFNTYSILELMAKILNKSTNICIIQQCLSFLSLLFQQASCFSQLLFLITEAIRFQFSKHFNSISLLIKNRTIKSNQMNKYHFQCEISELFGKEKIEAFKVKEMIKTQKFSEKVYNSTLKQVNKSVLAFITEFQRYKKGKIVFRKKKIVGSVCQQQIQQRQIFNIQKLAQQTHQNYKSQQIISLQLFRENEELIKVNKWLQQQLKSKQNTIAELLSINQKENIRAKLKIKSKIVELLVRPQVSLFHHQGNHSSRFPVTPQGKESLEGYKIDNSDGFGRDIRDSYKSIDSSNRRSAPRYTLPPHIGQNILEQIPKIDIPRERQRRNSFASLNQNQITQTSQIYQQATIKIIKSLEEQGRTSVNNQLLPPPPPPPILMNPPSLSSIPNLGIPNLLPPPPPPSLTNILPPPPPLLNMPPSLTGMPPPPLMGMPPLLLGPPPLISPFRNSQQIQQQPKLQMKNIGWNMLQSGKIRNTFWQSIEEPQVSLQSDKLVKLFSKNQKSYVPAKPAAQQQKSILKPDRIKNVQIVLKKMKITQNLFPIIKDTLLSYNQQYLQEEFLIGLLNLLPTSKERDQFLEVNFQGENWTLADKFLCFISKIDAFQQKVNSILFKQQFDIISASFFQKVEHFVIFFQDLKGDRFFQKFLQSMLTVGNFLNLGTNKGNARAFRIENIEKTYLLIGQDKQTSLFEYILEKLHQSDPELFDIPSLSKTSNIVPLPVLNQDYKYFQKKCNQVNECIILSQQDPLDESAPFFLPFYLKAREDVSTMKNQLQYATITFKSVKQFYGDKLQSQEMSKLIIDFRFRVNQWKAKNRNKKNEKR